jgi:P27 family predicted phage terminase small subunit
MNRKPPELHLVEGTKSRRNNATLLPDHLKKRIPYAEWMLDPSTWDKKKFVEETAEYLFEVYGIGSDQDRHLLAMLANNIDKYIKCEKGIDKNGIITRFNNGQTLGPNPFISVSNKTQSLIIQQMNELGLTPRSRLSSGKVEQNSPLAQFLKGPLAQ